jgi:hypothetical protein
MLKMIFIGLAVIVVVFVVIVALQSSDFRIARSTTISAPPPLVFAQVNDLHKWEAWNPWGKIDPAARPRAQARFILGPATTRSARDA